MQVEELIDAYPNLYHTAHANALEGICRHGLLSTSALLDRFEIPAADRVAIEGAHRPVNVQITHPEHGTAVIRDNKPLAETKLIRCLIDMTPAAYYRLLNGRVFFWLSRKRVERLLAARAYRRQPQIILVVETARLIQLHRDQISLSPINSGATLFDPPKRGSFTFQHIDAFDYVCWRRKRGPGNAIIELTVDYAVPDIMDTVIAVERRAPATYVP